MKAVLVSQQLLADLAMILWRASNGIRGTRDGQDVEILSLAVDSVAWELAHEANLTIDDYNQEEAETALTMPEVENRMSRVRERFLAQQLSNSPQPG